MKHYLIFQLLVVFFFTEIHGQLLVGRVEFKGNEKTRTSVLEKVVRSKEGMPLDSLLLLQDVAQLIRMPSVSYATYKIRESQDGEFWVVSFEIEENFTLIPFASIYTTNQDEFAYRVGLQEFNAFGRNITIGGFYQKDIFDSFSFHLRHPMLLSPRVGLALNYQNLTTQEPVFLENGTAQYRYNNESVEILTLLQLYPRHRLELGVNFFTEDYSYLSGATAIDVPDALRVDKYLIKTIYNYDGINYHYQYLQGFRNTLNVQYVKSADESQLPEFVIGFVDLSYFKRVGQYGNWANRLRIGLASNIDTPFAPFSVDNNLNIRGVGNTIDRGTATIVLNTEYRHTLVDKDWFVLQGNVFVDGGSWRNPGGDFSDFGKSQNIRIYPGVGLRFIHKYIFNAIFRIDYGYGVTPNSSQGIVFGIGQYF